jgi:esterase/lipase superfamily enzyme
VRRALSEWDEGERSALVFIYGFNVTFQEAAIRAAQIGFDLKVRGIVGLFSWPSKGRLGPLDYTADEAGIEASETHISDFLIGFAEKAQAERVHVIAHSMGNRGLLRAVQQIVETAARSARKIILLRSIKQLP